jgi:catechol 2,3-dioxygenase-like lactoylglutathione lyase family enzyme
MTDVTTLPAGDVRLEMVNIPVTDVDRARDFYVQQCGWTLITDHVQMTDMRIVQIVPPGSHCGILLGENVPGITDMAAGSQKGIHLVVPDITAARDLLAGNGVEVGEIQDMGGVLYSGFADPDGNMWLLQQWEHGGTHDYS